MAFKAEIWRRLGTLEHHGVSVNKEKTRRKTTTLCKHIQFWGAARRVSSQILEVFRQSNLIDRVTKVPLRRDSFPSAQLLPLSGKTDCADRGSVKATTVDQQEPLQTQCELLLLSPAPPFLLLFLWKQGRSHRTGKGRDCERHMLYMLYLLQVSADPINGKLCLTREIGSPQIQRRQRAGQQEHIRQQGALWTALKGSILPSTNIKWKRPRVAGKCRTAHTISLWGWSSGLCATWLFLWEYKEGIYFLWVHRVMLPLSWILLQLF